MLEKNEEIAANNLHTFIEFMREMKRYSAVSQFIEDFYVYFAPTDILLSPSLKTDSKIFYEDIFHYTKVPYETYVNEILTSYHYQDFLPVEPVMSDRREMQLLTFVHSLPAGEKSDVKGSLVILINEQKIKELLTNVEGAQNGVVFILNKEGRMLMSSSGDFTANNELLYSIWPEGKPPQGSGYGEYFNEENGTMMVTYTSAGENGWTYVSLVPKSVVLHQVNQVKTIALCAVLLCLLIGGVVCHYMAYRNYRPIRELVSTVLTKTNLQRKDKKNEFELIQDTLSDLFAQEKDMKQKLSRHVPAIRADFLSRLLRGQVDISNVSGTELDFMGVSFPSDSLAVVIIDIDDCSKFIRGDLQQEWALIRFILTNLCEELLQDQAYTVEMERERVVVLVQGERAFFQENRQLSRFIEELIHTMDERFKTKITVAVSKVHHGLDNIVHAYREAVFAMEYKMLKGHCTILVYDEVIQDNAATYHYPMELETQLTNYTRQGDEVQVQHLLDQIYEVNFVRHETTPEMGKYLLLDVFGTLLKLAYSLNIDRKILLNSEIDPVKYVSESATAREMMDKIKSCFMRICQHVHEERTDHSEHLYRKIKDFTENNYHDGMLSLTMLSDHLSMNASYLSTFFKNYSNQNISEYIVQVRLREAKRLLASTGLNMTEIAERVGYASNIALIRVFKKVEGITPGQYRANSVNLTKSDGRFIDMKKS